MALAARHPDVDWEAFSDVIYGCANQAGEDNRNVARMSLLLAGLPVSLPSSTVNRLCGSGMDAIGTAARAIKSGEAGLMLAGGVESMSRAPFVMPKATSAFSRQSSVEDTTIGWRFVNPAMRAAYGVDSMPETAENVAADFGISREDQDRMALASQLKAVAAQESGFFDAEITPVTIPQKKGEVLVVAKDEHPRQTSMEALARLKGVVRPGRHGNRRQCLGRQRWRLRADPGQRGCRSTPGPDAARARGGHGHRGCRAAHHGHRPGAGHAKSASAHRLDAGADGRDRAERGFRGAGPGRAAPIRPARR
jgi:acetyl-CoA acetyltransferase